MNDNIIDITKWQQGRCPHCGAERRPMAEYEPDPFWRNGLFWLSLSVSWLAVAGVYQIICWILGV